MSDNPAKMLKEAALAYKNGDKDTARNLLLQLVEMDQDNEKAWLLLSAVVDTLEDRQIALENVLTVNPNNEKARKGLALIEKKLGEQRKKTEQASSGWSDMNVEAGPARRTGTHPQYADDHEEQGSGFGNVPSFDQLASQSPASGSSAAPVQADDDAGPSWGDVSFQDLSANDAPLGETSISSDIPEEVDSSWGDDLPATSVDWNKDDNGAGYHGSGQDVEQPTADQYDEWVENLNLQSGGASSTPEPGTTEDDTGGWGDVAAANIFGDDSSSIATSPSMSTSPFNESSGWGDAASGTSSPFTTSDLDWGDVRGSSIEDDTGWGDIDTSGLGGGTAASQRIAGQSPFGASAVDDLPESQADDYSESLDTGSSYGGSDTSFTPTTDPFGDSTPESVEQPSFGLGDDPFADSEPTGVEADVAAPPTSATADSPEAKVKAQGKASAPQKRKRSDADWYKLIPGEIQAAGSIREQLPLIASVAVLGLLNVAALVALVMQL